MSRLQDNKWRTGLRRELIGTNQSSLLWKSMGQSYLINTACSEDDPLSVGLIQLDAGAHRSDALSDGGLAENQVRRVGPTGLSRPSLHSGNVAPHWTAHTPKKTHTHTHACSEQQQHPCLYSSRTVCRNWL